MSGVSVSIHDVTKIGDFSCAPHLNNEGGFVSFDIGDLRLTIHSWDIRVIAILEEALKQASIDIDGIE